MFKIFIGQKHNKALTSDPKKLTAIWEIYIVYVKLQNTNA